MRRYKCFSIILILLIFIVAGCDSPSGSKPDAITKPSLVSPTDNATNVSLTPTFQWNGTADKLEVSINLNFSPITYTANVSGQSHTIPAGKLIRGTRYFWHAGKSSGSDIYWSDDKFTFVTVP